MLKYAFNFATESGFIRKIGKREALKRFCNKNVNISRKSHNGQTTVNYGFSEIYFNRPAFQRNEFSTNNCNKPVILLSGILTALGLRKKTEEEESDLIMEIKRGILLIQKEKFVEAENKLHAALKLAQDQNDEDGVTYIHDILANLAFETGQFKKAEKLFVNILQRLMSKGEEENSNKVIHISLKLAKIFEATKDYKKAELGYKFCIDTLDTKLQEDDEDTLALWGMSMDWYGRFLLGLNKKTDALACFKKAYDMCVKVNGKQHEQTVVLLNDLGTVSSLIGDMESAVSYLEEARDIGDKLPEMKDLPAIYINLGQLYLLREMYKESRLACQEGLKKAQSYDDNVALSEAKQCLEKVTNAVKGSRDDLKGRTQILVH